MDSSCEIITRYNITINQGADHSGWKFLVSESAINLEQNQKSQTESRQGE